MPIPARLGDARVSVVDVALSGARITSDARFTAGAASELKFEWQTGVIDLECAVIRCTLFSFAKSPGQKSIYQTGLRIVETIGDSDRILRECIATHVIRALEEQKANARGIPPVGPFVDVSGLSDRYRKCELIDGKWRKVETSESDQPEVGFTISVEVATPYIDMLCETYQRSDDEGRRLTQTLAQLSITRGEGMPTRRYIP